MNLNREDDQGSCRRSLSDGAIGLLWQFSVARRQTKRTKHTDVCIRLEKHVCTVPASSPVAFSVLVDTRFVGEVVANRLCKAQDSRLAGAHEDYTSHGGKYSIELGCNR